MVQPVSCSGQPLDPALSAQAEALGRETPAESGIFLAPHDQGGRADRLRRRAALQPQRAIPVQHALEGAGLRPSLLVAFEISIAESTGLACQTECLAHGQEVASTEAC